MTQYRVRTQDEAVDRRFVPIAHTLIAGTTSGAADTVYTVRDNAAVIVRRLSVANTSGSAATLTMHAVPSGGAIAAGNTEIGGMSIAANSSVDLTELIGGFYDEGTTLEAFAGTTNVLVLHGWAEEIL